jgi:hypothetical protein
LQSNHAAGIGSAGGSGTTPALADGGATLASAGSSPDFRESWVCASLSLS